MFSLGKHRKPRHRTNGERYRSRDQQTADLPRSLAAPSAFGAYCVNLRRLKTHSITYPRNKQNPDARKRRGLRGR